MERKDELINSLVNADNKCTVMPLIEEVLFLENQLSYLKTLPFIRISKKSDELQKPTAAAKQYKELLQQYINLIKTLATITGMDSENEESPLRAYLKQKNGEDS